MTRTALLHAYTPGGRPAGPTLATVERPPDWMARGSCRKVGTPDDWFPTEYNYRATRHALAVCTWCPVIAECLSYAFDTDQRYGIWGGLTEQKRAAMKRSTR